jgi:hypothetical protein
MADKYNIELGREKRVKFRRQFAHLWTRYAEDELGYLKASHGSRSKPTAL